LRKYQDLAPHHPPSTLSSRRAAGAGGGLAELEEERGGRETADDLSSVSGYESLEGGLNSTDCLLSFANPNYSGPAVAGGRREEAADRHATAAQALMAPTADSSALGGMELREAPHQKAARPKSAFIQPSGSTELQARRPRPLSDGRLGEAVAAAAYPPQLRLLMYVIGGREVGQVTVFRRPLSIWRLELTRL